MGRGAGTVEPAPTMPLLLRAVPFIAAILLASSASEPAAATGADHAYAIRSAYAKLTETFYRTVDARTIADGARAAIAKAVRGHGTAGSPPPGEDPASILAAIDAARARSTLSETALTYAALGGMARAVHDKYTAFLSPRELHDFTAPLNPAHLFGIGVLLAEDEATHDVRASYVPPGTPADGAGIRPGDVFDAIDGVTVRRIGLQRTRAKLLGTRGTVVRVRMLRDGRPIAPYTIARADVHAPTVYQKLLPNKVGYIAVAAFGEPTAQEFGAAIARLRQQRASGYVIDLRFNGGGYVGAAVAIADTFIARGPIVSVSGRTGSQEYDADATAIAPKPMAILVNRYSASASEITAGALQDAGLATLVGDRTYGKGVVQELTYFNDGSALKVTTARYLTPRRRVIDGIGLAPDVAVAENKRARLGEPAADAQLAAALRIISGKIVSAR